MPNEEFDPFALSSGLADDYDFTFKNVHFGNDPTYVDDDGNMPVILIMDIASDDTDAGTMEAQNFSIGKGWEIQDRGAYVTRNGSMESNFNKNTNVGRWLQAAFECDGGEDIMRSRWEQNKLVPQQAAYWEGLRGHMKLKEVTNNIGGEVTKRDRPFPTAIYGWDAEAATAEPKPKKKATARKRAGTKKAAAAPEVTEPTLEDSLTPYQRALSEVEGKIVSQLKTIAADSDDADEFIDRAYKEIDGIDENEQIMLLVDDTDGANTIWAEAFAAWQESQGG